jgi:hypothetical protein
VQKVIIKRHFQVQDINGNPIPIPSISNHPEQAIVAYLTTPDEQTATPIPLTISAKDPSVAIAEIENLTTPGEYMISAELQDTLREFTPVSDVPIQIKFTKTDPWMIIYYVSMVIEILLASFILYLIIRAILVRLNLYI